MPGVTPNTANPHKEKRGRGYGDKNHAHTHDPQGRGGGVGDEDRGVPADPHFGRDGAEQRRIRASELQEAIAEPDPGHRDRHFVRIAALPHQGHPAMI